MRATPKTSKKKSHIVADKALSLKGQRMIQRATELDTFWAYKTEELPKDKQLLLLDNVQFIYELALIKEAAL